MRALSILGVSALLLQGCGIPGSPEEFDKTAEAKYLQATLGRLAAQDYVAITASFDQRVEQAGMERALQQMHVLLPQDAPLKREAVQWNFQNKFSIVGKGVSERISNVAIQYEYSSSRWILASATLSGEGGNLRLLGFHVQPLSASLADINAFTLQDKGLVHYLVLLMGLASVGIVLLAFVACLRTKGLKRKWLWAVCTLMTVSAFTLDWTSGETNFQLLHANFLGWGVGRSGWLGPWIMTVPFPLGAFIFLWRLGRRQAPETPAVTA